LSQRQNDPESPLHILRQFWPKTFFPDVEMGIRFYSRLPTRPTPHETPQLGQMTPVLGFASLIMGALPVLTLLLAYWIGLPPLLAAALAIGAQVLVTGAMAEDALADSADGLFGGKTPERRLEIMKDPRHGTYGVLAIVLLIAIRLTALGSLLASSEGGAVLLWLGAQIGARQGALWLVLALPSARAAGLAQSAGALSGKAFWTGGIISGAMIILITVPFLSIVGIGVSVAVMALIIWNWSRTCKNLVGGYSGDLIGALQALLEIAALSTFILFI
jgi:adenosylcobinamide-GDP ribazoletransferase